MAGTVTGRWSGRGETGKMGDPFSNLWFRLWQPWAFSGEGGTRPDFPLNLERKRHHHFFKSTTAVNICQHV